MIIPFPYLDVFVMLLFECLQLSGDVSRDGGAAGNVVDGAVTVGVHQKTLDSLVLGWRDGDAELAQFFPGI